MTDGLGTTEWTYDDLNRTTSVTDPFNQTIEYTYDALGNRTALIYPDGQTVSYVFDDVNQLVEVKNGQISAISYQYDAANRLSEAARLNGIHSTYAHDAGGRLLNLVHAQNGETLASYQYSYDAADNPIQVIENVLQPISPMPTPTLPSTETMTSTPTQTETAVPSPTGTAASTGTTTPTGTMTPANTLTPTSSPTGTPTNTITPTPLPTGEGGNPMQILLSLRNSVIHYTSIGQIDSKTSKSLLSKIDAIEKSLTDGKPSTAINQLQAFINEVSAQRGKKITAEAADDLIAQAQTIIAALIPPTATPLAYLPEGVSPISFKAPSALEIKSDYAVQQNTSLTINYDYDPLNRLTSAAYSDGRNFNYSYDANGNTLEMSDQSSVTSYQYDSANQLVMAQKDSAIWQFTYDANGSLTSNGVSTYIYDSANRLVAVDGAATDTTMTYNGLGQRLSMEASGVTTEYVMDGNNPLTADSGGSITTFLYGLGPIAEKTTTWNYALPDGSNTPRQLTNESGEITLATRYTPWGDTLELNGTGNFKFGYFGGLMDEATGLIYVGNGQYYDPATGRFLTRDANPTSPNPYIPFDPTGLLIAPLGLMAVFYAGRKSKKSAPYMMLLLVMVVLPLTVGLACGEDASAPSATPTVPPDGTPTPGGGTDSGGTSDPGAPSVTPIPCPEPNNWYSDEFLITHYTMPVESDPFFDKGSDVSYDEESTKNVFNYPIDF